MNRFNNLKWKFKEGKIINYKCSFRFYETNRVTQKSALRFVSHGIAKALNKTSNEAANNITGLSKQDKRDVALSTVMFGLHR
jgi:hypothetical protein